MAMKIGDKIKELRVNKKLTQKDLADFLGISPSTVGMYEQNRREPDSELFVKLARYFDVSVDYLLGRTDEKKPSAEVIDEELDKNVLVIRGSDGRYIRKKLTDDEIKSLEILLKSLPDVSEDV